MKTILTMITMITALLFSAGATAETIHGKCDALQGQGGGAYGLCVAICEVPAEDPDCEPTFVDGVLDEASLDRCRPASLKLVNKYLEKANGVELPCGNYTSSVSCPCPDPMMDAVANCNDRNDGGGQVNGVVQNGVVPSFLIATRKNVWTCRTRDTNGQTTLLPVPGGIGQGTEVDACIGIYRSYCPE